MRNITWLFGSKAWLYRICASFWAGKLKWGHPYMYKLPKLRTCSAGYAVTLVISFAFFLVESHFLMFKNGTVFNGAWMRWRLFPRWQNHLQLLDCARRALELFEDLHLWGPGIHQGLPVCMRRATVSQMQEMPEEALPLPWPCHGCW